MNPAPTPRRHMALLWVVNLCAITASTLSYIYLSYYVYTQTANVMLSQVVLFAPMILPVLLVAPLYRLADQLQPRSLLWSANLLSLLCAAATYSLIAEQAGIAVVGAVGIGVLDALQRVGRIVAIKRYCTDAQVADSVPLTLTAQFVAGGLAGLSMMAFKADMTPAMALAVTSLLFLVATLAAVSLPALANPTGVKQAAPRMLSTLLELLRDHPPARFSLLHFVLFISVFQGFFNVSRVLLPAHELGLGEAYVGLLQAVNSIAALLGAVLFYRLSRRGRTPSPLPMILISGAFMITAAAAIDAETSYVAYFFYIFCFELAFFKLQTDVVSETPSQAMPLVASVQYAGVYLGMIICIFLGSLLANAMGLFATSTAFVLVYWSGLFALKRDIFKPGSSL